jgi:ribosomal protein L24
LELNWWEFVSFEDSGMEKYLLNRITKWLEIFIQPLCSMLQGYGSVKFLGETDVRRLDLESIVQFNKCEVVVYMDKSKKPAVGQGLNKPAEVTLSNVKCVDKKTGQQCLDRSDVEKFEKRLKKKTEEQGAEFISYQSLKGEWKFQVKHFSWYGLQIKKSEDDILGKAQVLAGMMTTMPRF